MQIQGIDLKRKNKVVILPYFYVVYQQFSLTEPKIKNPANAEF